MPAPPVTFPCPFCGKRMGVSADFLGKQVRCPHCRQVVLAPSAATAPGAPAAPPPPPPAPAPAPRPQPVATEPDLPQFSVPAAREGTDSILGDPNESEDDVFGTQPGTRLLNGPFDPPAQQPPLPPPAPPRPAPLPDLEVTTTPENPFALAQTEPTGIPRSSLPQLPRTTELTNPFPDLEPVSMPGTFAPVPQPPPPAPPPPAPPRAAPLPVSLPASYPTTAPAGAPSNPFAGIDESVVVAPPPAPAPVAERTEPVAEPRTARRSDSGEAPIARPPRRGAATKPASSGGGGANPVLLYVVLGWAVLATLLAVYGLVFRYGTRIDPGHPLSTIPDNYGEFGPAQRKNTGSVRVDGNLELPANQRAQLNQTIKVGQLEVTPKEIVRRRLMLVEDRGAGERPPQARGTALVMKLEIKNRSTVPLFPMDPAFLRTSDPQNQPLTRLVVGRQTFYGGAIPWPFAESIKRRREVQQQNDYEPLAPDEPRDYVVFTDDQKPDIVKAVGAAREPLQWRVQVRSGLLDLDGKQYPITSVFAVDFRALDITNPAG